jgi:ribonuclease HI
VAERFRAAFDGGSRGNPGPAAWAVVVIGEDGRCIEGHGGSLGTATNNVAEYHGLLEALDLASAKGAREVVIQSDSELIVKQLRGAYRVRHPGLIPLHAEAMRRIAGFVSFRIRHVRREDNREADRLVNVVLDRVVGAAAGETIRIVDLPAPRPAEVDQR